MPNQACESTIVEYFSAIRAMDVERYVQTFAEDAVVEDPVGSPPLRTQDARRQFLTGINSLFQSVDLIEEHVYANGDSVAVKWIGKGVGRNGKAVSFEGIDVIDCNAVGKIQTVRAFWDPAPVMQAVQA